MRTILSRRRLGFGALGATLVGSRTAVADDRPNRRQAPWTFAPIPVVGGTSGLSPIGAFHVFGGPGQEPSTISNFKGSSGIAVLSGNVTRTNIKTGDQQSFSFDQNTDMRFMTGTFVGADGQEHQGTFAFV
ncbi:MAG: hypothetical protein WA864_21970 [Acetobacteraceae bacterium]